MAIYQALQEDRKAIARVTLNVTNGGWDSKLKSKDKFRGELLQSLAIAAGLESSDRGKAYVLAAIEHIAKTSPSVRKEALAQLLKVEEVFQAYARTGADPKFEKERIKPLQAIIEAVNGDAQQRNQVDRRQA
jgi:hypothetical protein